MLLGSPGLARPADTPAGHQAPPGDDVVLTEASPAEEPLPRFRDRDGAPSPFPDDAAVLSFLRTAPIVSATPIGKGVTGALKVVLRNGPVEARAAFHDIDIRKTLGTIQGRPVPFFVDSYRSQIAAYELSRLMGLDHVPPTVERSYQGRRGSLHFWIEGATDLDGLLEGKGPKIDPGDRDRQLQDVWVFDALIRNMDRNRGNLVFDADGRLWWIDHTRAFGRGDDLVGVEKIQRCSRKMLEALRALDAGAVRHALSPYISVFEIEALMKRRDLLVEHIEELVARRGEASVLIESRSP